MKDEPLDIPEFLRRPQKEMNFEKSKTASNELLGGREAGNNDEGDGKINSPPLGSQKCPACDGTGVITYDEWFALWSEDCEECKGTGAK